MPTCACRRISGQHRCATARRKVGREPLPRANGAHGVSRPTVSLVNCFYRLANPSTIAMRWEAVAVNADFWSQVLQSQSLKPLDFALGAAILVRRNALAEIGGFQSLADCLADDYQLGHRIAKNGHRIALCPVVAECWGVPMNWRDVWKHQLRWARTIRVCQPLPYFFSILSNVGFWSLLLFFLVAGDNRSNHDICSGFGSGISGSMKLPAGVITAIVCCLIRLIVAFDLQRRLTARPLI